MKSKAQQKALATRNLKQKSWFSLSFSRPFDLLHIFSHSERGMLRHFWVMFSEVAKRGVIFSGSGEISGFSIEEKVEVFDELAFEELF